MFILYFNNEHHDYYHAKFYASWPSYNAWRAGERAWLVPGTDPDDPFYV